MSVYVDLMETGPADWLISIRGTRSGSQGGICNVGMPVFREGLNKSILCFTHSFRFGSLRWHIFRNDAKKRIFCNLQFFLANIVIKIMFHVINQFSDI